MKDEFGITFYDESVNSIGVHRSMKPLMYQVPLMPGSIFISYTDGIQAAGKKYSKEIDMEYIKKIIAENLRCIAPVARISSEMGRLRSG